MQAEYPNNIYGKITELDAEKLKDLLSEGATNVNVFTTGSDAHKEAEKRAEASTVKFSSMTRNQQKRLRKRGYR